MRVRHEAAPRPGQTRTRSGFVWLPRTLPLELEDGTESASSETRWLERTTWREETRPLERSVNQIIEQQPVSYGWAPVLWAWQHPDPGPVGVSIGGPIKLIFAFLFLVFLFLAYW